MPATKRKAAAAELPSGPLTKAVSFSDEQRFIESRSRSRKPRATPPSIADDDEEEDVGRTESQKFLAAAKAHFRPSKREERFFCGFKNTVGREGRELLRLLEDMERESVGSDAEFRRAMRSQLSAALTQRQGLKGSQEMVPASPPFAQAGAQLLDLSKTLLATYDEASQLGERATSSEMARLEEWRRDVQNGKRLLGLGQRVARRHIEGIMKTAKERAREEGAEDDGLEEVSVFAMGRMDREEGKTLGDLLGDAEKGVKKMTRGLPPSAAF